jgi:NitT/TauT family transport system permease protein
MSSAGSPPGEASAERKIERWRGTALRGGVAILAIGLLVLLWWAVAVLGNMQAFILPTPFAVGERVWGMMLDGSLFRHVWVTVLEAALGFLLAFAVGTGTGYAIGHSRLLERFLSPYIAVSQGLPVVALAPLLTVWFGSGLLRYVLIVALIVFFPILVNTMVAVKSIDRSMYEVARIEGASRLQTLWYVELPLGLRSLFGGWKIGLMLAITGAVIGEIVSSSSGLGFLLILGRGIFDTELIFVGLVSLATLTVVVYTAVTVLERALIDWE